MKDLYMFQSTLLPVISLSSDACADLRDSDRTALISKIECAQNNVQTLINSIDKMSTATLRDDLMRRANLQYMYLEQVKLGLRKSCPVAVSATSYFYNLANSRWIWGTRITNQDLISAYNYLSQNGGSVTICPAQTPFVKPGVNQCFACNGNQIYDLTQQACISCPGNTTYNSSSHRCECPCDCYVSNDGFCMPKSVVYANGNYLNLAGFTTSSITNYLNRINQTLGNPTVTVGQCNER